MRRPFIAGNWKMNLSLGEAEALAQGIAGEASQFPSVEVAVCPPHVYLGQVAACLADSPVGLGAQNIYFEPNGAYTGEVSAQMVKELGCRYTILGHSERRQLLGESDAVVNKKLHAALHGDLIPIVCFGETLEQRQSGETLSVISAQFAGSLEGISPTQMSTIVIAYEPVWAIGTGQVATPDQAQAVHETIRKLIVTTFDAETAAQVRIQYGGSVKPANAAELLAQPDIDGALVGGASLTTDSFMGIITAANERCATN